jgi:D-amino-acid dehydrogenase
VQFRFGTAVERLESAGGRVSGVRLAGGERVVADKYVVAFGSYSPLLLRPLGIRIPVYPAKGYSITVPLGVTSIAPRVSLTDDGAKLVFSRLGSRLRVAGTAEFTGYDTSINAARCAAIVRRTRLLFPQLGEAGDIDYWAGLRPATPGNVPVVGATSLANLFINTGHGTLGWTMACGSGALLADLVTGRPPAIDPAPYATA